MKDQINTLIEENEALLLELFPEYFPTVESSTTKEEDKDAS